MIPKDTCANLLAMWWRNVSFGTGMTLFLAMILFVVSCQSLKVPNPPDESDPFANATVVSGRIVYRGSSEAFTLLFRWKSIETRYQLLLRDKLGMNRALIQGSSTGADIKLASGESLKNIDVQRWLDEELSISIPILELPHCLNLECDFFRSGTDRVFDSTNRLSEFNHAEWNVQLQYQGNSKDKHNLKEIRFSSDDTRLRMIFDT